MDRSALSGGDSACGIVCFSVVDFSQRNFAPSDFVSERGKTYTEYLLTRDGTSSRQGNNGGNWQDYLRARMRVVMLQEAVRGGRGHIAACKALKAARSVSSAAIAPR